VARNSVSWKAADVFVGRFSYEFLRKCDTGSFDCFMFFPFFAPESAKVPNLQETA
jgi:hypothetical protein